MRQSAAGLQLLQAAVSHLLTVLKLQGVAGPGEGLLPGDLSFCIVAAIPALRSVADACVAGMGSSSTSSGGGGSSISTSGGGGSSSSRSSRSSSGTNATHLELQLLARCLHRLGSRLDAALQGDVTSAFNWLAEKTASPTAIPMDSHGDSHGACLMFDTPSRNVAGLCVAAAAAWAALSRACKGAGGKDMGGWQHSSSSSSANVAAAVAGSETSCPETQYVQCLEQLASSSSKLRQECSALAHTINQIQEQQEQQQSQQQRQQQQQQGQPQDLPRAPPAATADPAFFGSAIHVAAAMKELALQISTATPCRCCCANVACTNLASLSECFALVRGRACVCGGCMDVRWVVTSHWQWCGWSSFVLGWFPVVYQVWCHKVR
jgi:hypothetical protein